MEGNFSPGSWDKLKCPLKSLNLSQKINLLSPKPYVNTYHQPGYRQLLSNLLKDIPVPNSDILPSKLLDLSSSVQHIYVCKL